jgi:DNA-binding transcriptional MerR regulator
VAKLSKSDAAKTIGVTRQTLYAYIKQGRISMDPEGTIDTAELLRAGFVLRPITTSDGVNNEHDLTSSPDILLTHRLEAVERERDLLQRELDDAKAEKARLLTLLEQSQQQQQRLLEAGQKPSRWAKWWRRK